MMTSRPGGLVPLTHLLAEQEAEMVALLSELVEIESPSDDPAALGRAGDRLASLFARFGHIDRHPFGDGTAAHVVLSIPGTDPTLPHVAVLAHYDTVWPLGTLARMPCRVDNARGVLTGPGSFDMKGGIVALYYALLGLREVGTTPRRPVTVLMTGDEEVRSHTSRPLISKVATGAAAALVLESPLPGGALKTRRKGSATYHLTIEGRAAHAGIEPEKGASAVVELAHQIPELHALNNPAQGTSVNVGVVSGGTRSNVVAAHARADIDVRTTTAAEAARVDEAIKALTPRLSGTRLIVAADLSRPPMEQSPASRELYERACRVSAALDLGHLGEGGTGGASDANLTAAMGVPTLDGLGPEGDGAHANHEHVLVASLPRRAALLAGLLAGL